MFIVFIVKKQNANANNVRKEKNNRLIPDTINYTSLLTTLAHRSD